MYKRSLTSTASIITGMDRKTFPSAFSESMIIVFISRKHPSAFFVRLSPSMNYYKDGILAVLKLVGWLFPRKKYMIKYRFKRRF